MGINIYARLDLYTPKGEFQKFSIPIIAISHTIHMGDIFKIPVQILPEKCTTLPFRPKHTFPDGNQRTCQG